MHSENDDLTVSIFSIVPFNSQDANDDGQVRLLSGNDAVALRRRQSSASSGQSAAVAPSIGLIGRHNLKPFLILVLRGAYIHGACVSTGCD